MTEEGCFESAEEMLAEIKNLRQRVWDLEDASRNLVEEIAKSGTHQRWKRLYDLVQKQYGLPFEGQLIEWKLSSS